MYAKFHISRHVNCCASRNVQLVLYLSTNMCMTVTMIMYTCKIQLLLLQLIIQVCPCQTLPSRCFRNFQITNQIVISLLKTQSTVILQLILRCSCICCKISLQLMVLMHVKIFVGSTNVLCLGMFQMQLCLHVNSCQCKIPLL